MRDVEIKWSHTLLLCVLIGGMLWLIHWNNLSSTAKKTPDSNIPRTVASAKHCSTIVRQCVAEATVKNEHCDRQKSRHELGQKLAYPLKDGPCREELSNLDQNCPDGCRLDYTQIMTIPGQIQYKIGRKPDESGNCSGSATMPVSISARCVTDE